MPFQILSLSGGGYLGLYTATILAGLERRFGAPIASHFDLLAGTSVGGLTALALAREVRADTIKDAFEERGSDIFARPSWLGWLAGPFRPPAFTSKYGRDALRATAASILGEDTRIGDLRHPVIVPAVNLSTGRPQLFKTPHHPNFLVDLDRRVVDVAMATSAAPTFFPLATIGDTLYADGGLFANSPDLLALHEATTFFQQAEADVSLLSVGTTTSTFSFASQRKRNFGIAQWMKNQRLPSVVIAAQQRSVDFMVGHRLPNRYLRLDETQSKEQSEVLGLDRATPIARQTIRALAEATIQREIGNPLLQRIMQRQAPPPTFFHAPAPRA